MATDVLLNSFNTIALTGGTAYKLIPRSVGSFKLNLLNLGPGTLYVRGDATDPVAGDPNACTLPAGSCDNTIPVSGSTGLRILTPEDGSITVRLEQ